MRGLLVAGLIGLMGPILLGCGDVRPANVGLDETNADQGIGDEPTSDVRRANVGLDETNADQGIGDEPTSDVRRANVGLDETSADQGISDEPTSADALGRWPEEVLAQVEMLADKSVEVRRGACFDVVEHVREITGAVWLRQALVGQLAKRLVDESSIVRVVAARLLTTLRPDDFGPDSKMSIADAFHAKPTKQLILLGGLADVAAVNKRIDELVFDPSYKPSVGRFYGGLKWAAALVRARRGEKSSIQKVIKAVDEEDRMVIAVTVLLRELEYVRQPEVVITLKRFLDSDARLSAVKSTVPGAKYAQYAAVRLARMLEGFPVVKEDLNFTEHELDVCRRWMAVQEEWVFK